jgi:hypothetical protein
VTAAYHEMYDRYGPRIVGTVVSSESAMTTLRLVPRWAGWARASQP